MAANRDGCVSKHLMNLFSLRVDTYLVERRTLNGRDVSTEIAPTHLKVATVIQTIHTLVEKCNHF